MFSITFTLSTCAWFQTYNSTTCFLSEHNLEFRNELPAIYTVWQVHATYDNKSVGKRRNTLGCKDQFTCQVLRLWNCQDRETVLVYKYVQRMEAMKQSRLWISLGTHGSLVVKWCLCISSSGETIKIWLFKSNWTLKVKVNCSPKQ